MGQKMTPFERVEQHIKNLNKAFEDLKRITIEQPLLTFADVPQEGASKKRYDYQGVCDLWNAQPRLIKNKKLNETLKKLIRDILMEYNMEEVEQCFTKYNTILGDGYWFSYDKWTLTTFLKSKKGFEKIFDNTLQFYVGDRKIFNSKNTGQQYNQVVNASDVKVEDVAPTIMMELAFSANMKNTRDLDHYRGEIERIRKKNPKFNVYEHYDSIKQSIDPLVKMKIDRIIKYNN